MFNTDLLWYLLIPLFLSIATVVAMIWNKTPFSIAELIGTCAGGLVISALILVIAFALGRGYKTHDTEILNGQVTGKTREHGHYLRPYECNCTTSTDSKGNTTRTCQTCYEDRYTVSWDCQSTIGEFSIEHLDRGSKSVYNEPDPRRYTSIMIGEPVSRTHGYTNYIKAVPESLFRPAQESLRAKFQGKLPNYPDRIYDIYRINRVLGVGISVPNAKAWNNALSEMLKTLGPRHEVNAVIVFVKTADRDFFSALQDAWINGKKNDVILVVGVDDFNKAPLWVETMAFTKNSLFQVKLSDRVRAMKTLTPETVIPALQETIQSDFIRRPMADFEYLEAEIDPPGWIMAIAIMLIVGAYGWFWYAFSYGQGLGSLPFGSSLFPRQRRYYTARRQHFF